MSKKINNPFLLVGYAGEAFFCDREKELAILKEHFQNERNVVLYAWRRLGKTALLKHLMHSLEKNDKSDALYVDMMGVRKMERAIEIIANAVLERYGRTENVISAALKNLLMGLGAELSFDAVSGQPKLSIGWRDASKASPSLHAIGNFLKERKHRVLIIIDEFQEVQQFSDVSGEAVFRTWMQEFPEIRFIFSGSHSNMLRTMFTHKNRPFYRSAQLLKLEVIPLDAYLPFIQQHFKANKKAISKEAVEASYAWARGQTYYVQLICNKLYAQFDKVESTQLKPVLDDILTQESAYYVPYLQLLTDMQWKVLKAIAAEERVEQPNAKAFIQKYKLGAASSVNTALKMLLKTELVIQEDDAYLLQDVLLMRWAKRLSG